MSKRKMALSLAVAALLAAPIAAETVAGLPLHVKKMNDKVVRLWAGDYVSSTAVTAIATAAGIVVIDTTEVPRFDHAFREVIAREFGRRDFKYLINTHGHGDHTNGNGVYADCEIIAHEAVPEMMKENLRDIARLTAWREEEIKRLDGELAMGKLGEAQKAVALESRVIGALGLEFLQSNPQPTLPTRTFRGALRLDCGDATIELFQAGGTHTRSDIFILVSPHGLLFTGDMMADRWLTDTPGCLATFALRSGAAADYPVLMKNWQALLERQDEIAHYLPGHWNGELSAAGFKARFAYAQAMLADVQAMVAAGGDFNGFHATYTLKQKFPALDGTPGCSAQSHSMSLQHLYCVFAGKRLFIEELQPLVMGDRFAADFPALRAAIVAAPQSFFFTEGQLNGLAYFVQRQLKKPDEALQLFQLYADLFPGSWNAWDSLAEAYYVAGDKARALELYRKSLQLNPANENGKTFVARIESELK